MTDSTKQTILMMAKADTTVTAKEMTALETFLKRMETPVKAKLITGKAARTLLGQADGRMVSRPYLKSLVDHGRLHPVRLSSRKVRYDENEVLSMFGR